MDRRFLLYWKGLGPGTFGNCCRRRGLRRAKRGSTGGRRLRGGGWIVILGCMSDELGKKGGVYHIPMKAQSKNKQLKRRRFSLPWKSSLIEDISSSHVRFEIRSSGRQQNWLGSATYSALFLKLTLLRAATASSVHPWATSHLGDSCIPSANERAIDMIRQRLPSTISIYRQPILLERVHVSALVPLGQLKFITSGHASGVSIHLNR
jgi:hypothetical protein